MLRRGGSPPASPPFFPARGGELRTGDRGRFRATRTTSIPSGGPAGASVVASAAAVSPRPAAASGRSGRTGADPAAGAPVAEGGGAGGVLGGLEPALLPVPHAAPAPPAPRPAARSPRVSAATVGGGILFSYPHTKPPPPPPPPAALRRDRPD